MALTSDVPTSPQAAQSKMIPTKIQRDLAHIVMDSLEHAEAWTRLQIYEQPAAPRVLISGLPPRRIYIHPDEQIEIIKAESALAKTGTDEGGQPARIPQPPEHEWILPVHLSEKLSVSQYAAIFDSIGPLPPGALADQAAEAGNDDDSGAEWRRWRGSKRLKRILLAVVQDDSTIVYYIMHDGIVKPRQN